MTETIGSNVGAPARVDPRLKAQVAELKARKAFSFARRLLSERRRDIDGADPGVRLWLAQQQALCTYKDNYLPAQQSLDEALAILESEVRLADCKDSETLGLAGAIHKRYWEVDGRREHLEKAFSFYFRGYLQVGVRDTGYCAVNAAFLLDLMGSLEPAEFRAVSSPESMNRRSTRAQQLRREIIGLDVAGTRDFWALVTRAEAHFGLGEYTQARQCIERGLALSPDDWMQESAMLQMLAIARLQAELDGRPLEETSAAWECLKPLLPDEASPADVAKGKVGLALSGGGFRASFFHLGVLAKLAEAGLLHRVEALSCVSGGSIIGALYYLELRKLLQQQATCSAQDYVDLVARLIPQFLEGVQKNLRMRLLRNPLTNLKLAFISGYTHTLRAGELFERHLYKGRGPRALRTLKVAPVGSNGERDASFNPVRHNWKRASKVPVLILNATCLNTGHAWHFTPTYMGEPPGSIDPEVDSIERLPRMYYDRKEGAGAPGDMLQAVPSSYTDLPLGHAVAASACVPGLFEPLALTKLRREQVVRLVDGGVGDNQGVQGLLEQGCDFLIVSDGSGQMERKPDPGGGPLATPLRSNSVLMARVRSAQFTDVKGRCQHGLLKDFIFVHLKQGLTEPLPRPKGSPAVAGIEAGSSPETVLAPEVQLSLARIRTDLDAFNELEAYALMLSGYSTMERSLGERPGVAGTSKVSVRWPFLQVAPLLEPGHPRYAEALRVLRAGAHRSLKPFHIVPWLGWGGRLLAAAALGGGLVVMYLARNTVLLTARGLLVGLGLGLGVFLLNLLIGGAAGRWLSLKDRARRLATGLPLASMGWLVASINALTLDKLFLRRGSLKTFGIAPSGDAREPA